MLSKLERHQAIRERAATAIRDLYHNATPEYPRELYGRSDECFQIWFEDSASFEIEYLQDGGAYGSNYHETLEAAPNAGRYTSARARAYYIRWKMQSMREERARCNSLDSREALTNAMWEYISEYGTLYQWGRGGRTLAPDGLVRQGGGGSFGLREDYADDMPIAAAVRLIQIVESFNATVEAWNKGVPKMWREYCQAEDEEERAARYRARAKKAAATRARKRILPEEFFIDPDHMLMSAA